MLVLNLHPVLGSPHQSNSLVAKSQTANLHFVYEGLARRDVSRRCTLKRGKKKDISAQRHLDSHTHEDHDLNFQCLPLGKHRCTQGETASWLASY